MGKSRFFIIYNMQMIKNRTTNAIGVLLAFVLACVGLCAASSATAWADGEAEVTSISDLQMQVEDTAAAYDDASAKVAELQTRIDENNAKQAAIQAALPAQQAKADASFRAMYKMQKDGNSVTNLLLSAGNVNDFLKTWQYLNDMQEKNAEEIAKLDKMQNDLNAAQTQIAADKIKADENMAEAQEAFAQAVAARELAQQQAMAAAEAEVAASQGAVTETVAAAEVNWNSDKDTFVNNWTPRIDNYLAGSPLAGQGKNFATAAWDYGVDPRWSPAISTIESSKGVHCFKPCNAWGWGSYSFGSWDEAVPKHVRYLGECYGYTVTPSAARKYCPPNATAWYNNVSSEMNKI